MFSINTSFQVFIVKSNEVIRNTVYISKIFLTEGDQ